MRLSKRRHWRLLVVVVASGIAAGASVAAERSCCPFCAAPSLTLSEQVAQSDAVVLVQWVEGQKAREVDGKRLPSSTTYQVREIVRSAGGSVKKGQKVKLFRYRAAEPGDLFLLLGSKGINVEWGAPLEVSETSYQYIVQAPAPEAPAQKRLAYFIKFLEFPDRLIANDAYFEFANSPYKDIVGIKELIPRKKVRRWVSSSATPRTRMGLYGLLMGLGGSEKDAELMLKQIATPTGEFRIGFDGVISGYLLLSGEKGLDEIDRLKLKTQFQLDDKGGFLLDKNGKKKALPFSEVFSSMQALRFMWTYADGRIAPERLKQSMRILLDQPDLADLAIADLARWKDWSIQDRLMAMYDDKNFQVSPIKKAIVRFMLVSSKDLPKDAPKDAAKDAPEGSPVDSSHVAKALKHLKTLRKKDPKTVQSAERFFFVK